MIVLAVDTALTNCAVALVTLAPGAAGKIESNATGPNATGSGKTSSSEGAQGEPPSADGASETHAETDARVLAAETAAMTRGHAEALLPMVARVMTAAGADFSGIDRIAVTVGPGSFTGLRVGISAARGLGLASGKPVVGVTTLAALAAPLAAEEGLFPIISAIDARHGHVYFQVTGGRGTILIRPRAGAIAEAVAASRFGACRLVGDAAALLAENWPARTQPPAQVLSQSAPDIEWVARLGAAIDPKRAPPKPLYLRAPDAKPQVTEFPLPR